MEIILSQKAAKEFRKLPNDIQNRIKKKLKLYANSSNPLEFAKPMVDSDCGDYRFRIGDYRLLFDIANNNIYILKIGHRRNIYQ